MPDSQYRISALYVALVDKHEQDLYRGNGKPGITTRLERSEDRLDSLEDYNVIRNRKIETRLNLLIGGAFSLAISIFTAALIWAAKH